MPRTNKLSRNFPIIDRTLQKKIARCKILFVGCGLGSNIAVLAARVGFNNFFLADGDKVEISNINRQEFNSKNVGLNKAIELSKIIKKISPNAKVKVSTHFLQKQSDISRAVSWSDIVINTADFDKGFYSIISEVGLKSKLVICPFNVGFGSAVVVFNQNNVKGILKADISGLPNGKHFFNILSLSRGYAVPNYFMPTFKKIIFSKRIKHIPQVGPASYVTASKVVTMLINAVQGNRIKLFPRVNRVELIDV